MKPCFSAIFGGYANKSKIENAIIRIKFPDKQGIDTETGSLETAHTTSFFEVIE